MTMQEITDYLDRKIEQNENKVTITFYEARIKMNLSDQDTDTLLKYCKTRLENLGYQIFFTGAKFEYKEKKQIVEQNELMIAIKE